MKARPSQNPGEVTLELRDSDAPLMEAAARMTPKSPFNLKHILVPVDFSDCSKKALEYALPLAHAHKAVITLLFVVEPAYDAGGYGGVDYSHLERDAKEHAEKQLEEIAATESHDDVSLVTLVRTGSPSTEIIGAAESLPADLIVISTHGRTGLKHVFLGSVAEHVVQRAPCPVLVVREHEREILAPLIAA